MRTRLLCLLLLLSASLIYAACDEKLSTLSGPTPELEPRFASIQANIFESSDTTGRQACTACHTSVGRNPSGGLNLDHDVAYQNLVRVASRGKPGVMRVLPGDADSSYLIHKIAGAPDIAGRRMPTGGPPFLSDGQIFILRRWIATGARQD